MIKNRIREFRTRFEMSQSELSEKLTNNPGKFVISLIENGHVLPTVKDLQEICEVLSCKADDLYDPSDLHMYGVPADDDLASRSVIIPEEFYPNIVNALEVAGYKNREEWVRESIRKLVQESAILQIKDRLNP